jgi:hypothetical protein
VLVPPIVPAEIPGLCEGVKEALARWPSARVVCDAAALLHPDLVAVEALLRLQLTSLRLGRRLRVRHACSWLRELVAFAGLGEVLLCPDALPVQPGRKSEQREPPGRVEEECDPRHPVA